MMTTSRCGFFTGHRISGEWTGERGGVSAGRVGADFGADAGGGPSFSTGVAAHPISSISKGQVKEAGRLQEEVVRIHGQTLVRPIFRSTKRTRLHLRR